MTFALHRVWVGIISRHAEPDLTPIVLLFALSAVGFVGMLLRLIGMVRRTK